MSSRVRVIFYVMMVILIALASAFSVIPARADDGVPPPPAAPAAPAVHSQTPAGTDMVVVNAAGHKVSLASQQAADIYSSTDPIWCPSGVAPKPGLGGCTSTQSTFNGGLLPLIVNEPKNGTIWILSGPVADVSPVTLGGSLGTTINHALTLNGGWNGSPSGSLNPLMPSVISVPLAINWNAAVTINNITITGAAGDGLTVTSHSNIVLNNVNANHNTGKGASLDNSSGITGTVVVNNSVFNDNTDDGLQVFSNRAISAANLTAYHNGGVGAYLDNSNASTFQPVKISGVNNNFSFNGKTGLDILSIGAITLSNVTASYNSGLFGAYLDNCFYDNPSGSCTTTGIYAVTLKGSNNFTNNASDGLDVYASGALNVNNLAASDNGTNSSLTDWAGMGAYLNNYGSRVPRNLMLTGTNTFTGNAAAGLWMDSWGVVKVNNLTASGNGNNVNCLPVSSCDGVHLEDSAAFTITGYGAFNGNGDDGLEALGWGAMTLPNLYAVGNNGSGVYLDNSYATTPSPITLTGANLFTDNRHTGLVVYSFGPITLTNITALHNGLAGDPTDGYGAYIDNCLLNISGRCDVSMPKPVSLNGINYFNNNFSDGLWINSLGIINLKKVTASGNGGRGAYIDNQWGYMNSKIILSGSNVFNLNASIGLEAYSNSTITISNLTANGNNGGTAGAGVHAGGAYLENRSITLLPVAVTLTGVNTFNNNGLTSNGSGLIVYSDGAITVSNLTADNNKDHGAYLDNTSAPFNHLHQPRNITLTGVNNFWNNVNDGLDFNSSGAFNAAQVTAELNAADGVHGVAAGKITLTCGVLYNNGVHEYYLISGINITLKGVYSYNNPNVAIAPVVSSVACPIP